MKSISYKQETWGTHKGFVSRSLTGSCSVSILSQVDISSLSISPLFHILQWLRETPLSRICTTSCQGHFLQFQARSHNPVRTLVDYYKIHFPSLVMSKRMSLYWECLISEPQLYFWEESHS